MNFLQTPGDAPDGLSAAERKAWDDILAHALPGAYGSSERPFLELAARMLARYRASRANDDGLIGVALVQMLLDAFLPPRAIVELMSADPNQAARPEVLI